MSVWSDRTCGRTVADGTSLQPVRCEKENKSTVFLFPGLDGGDIWEFAPLLSMVDAPLHFVPIRYRHWSELQPEPDELDRLVTDCVSQIESHGPPSTIYLVGYSFGAQMIWAAARAMATAGHRIGLLGLIDAPAFPQIRESAASVGGRLGRLFQGIRHGKTSHQLARSTAGMLFRSRTGLARMAFRRLHSLGLLPRIFNHLDANVQMRYHLILLRECTARLAASHGRIHCPAVLFRCADRPMYEETDLGWSRYMANLRLVTLSGNHDSVLQPQNVERITYHITAMIAEETTNFVRNNGSLARE
jgi:thioesterase domain-containing protein